MSKTTTAKQNYLTGAVILAVATAVVKVIGAIFKIPLGNLLGTEGYAIFSTAYDVYSTLFVLSTAGLPVAMSKMVSESLAEGRGIEVSRIFRVSMLTFLALGVVGTAALFLFAAPLAELMGNPDAAQSISAIAPAMFFVCIVAAFRGYHQGHANMVPTAVSQVLEALCKLFLGYALAAMLMASSGVIPAAAGAIGGVTIGTAVADLYLMFRGRRRYNALGRTAVREARPSSVLVKKLLAVAIPITIGASVLSLTNLIDSALVMDRVQGSAGMGYEMAKQLRGTYAYAVTIFNFPPAFIATLAVSVIPAIASARVRRDFKSARATTRSALRICALLALPCAGGIVVLAEPIMNLLFGGQAESVSVGAPLLAMLGWAVLFVCLVTLTNSILQSMGLVSIPVLTMLVGGAAKIICNYVLVGNPEIHINGAPVGTLVCYALITVLNLVVIKRAGQVKGIISLFVKPVIATALMMASAYASYGLLGGLLGAKVGVVVAILIAVVVYLFFLLVLQGLPKADLLLLPKGEKIAKILRIKN